MSETKTTTVVKADSEDLIIAGWTLHANAYQIERGGKRIKLEPKATLVLAHHQEAIETFNIGLSSNPASERMRVWLAASLAQSGNIEAAKWEGEQIMAADPDFSLQRMARAFPFKNPDEREHFVSALRLAGLQ